MGKPKIYIDGKEGTTGLRIYERLGRRDDLELLLIDDDKRKDLTERKKYVNAADLVFFCLPDAAAEEAVALIENDHTRIIDASSAHRVSPGWVYGFPELNGQRERIRTANRVANPGCYATGFIALVRPLVELGILPQDYHLVCHALSGYTGGGKKAIAQYEDSNREEALNSPRHYGMGLTHKHLPEMAALCGLERGPIFSPVICDYPQGMVVTVPLHLELLNESQSVEALRAAYINYYKGEALVTILPADAPSCGFIGANHLAGRDGLQIFVNGNGEQAVLTARLDNLGKGASGAAVQNMNLMLGLNETISLTL